MTNSNDFPVGTTVLVTNRLGETTRGVVVPNPRSMGEVTTYVRVLFQDGPAAGTEVPVKTAQLVAAS